MASIAPAILAGITRQIRALATNPPEGVKFYPSETSLTDIDASIAGPVDTPYFGGIFHLRLTLGPDYPSAPPKGIFLTRIFHPNISAAGEICVNTLKRDWTPDTTLSHVLAVVRCLLIVPFPESSLNDDAGKLFMESYDDYARKARLWTSIHATEGRGGGVASAEPAREAGTAAPVASGASAKASEKTEPVLATPSGISTAAGDVSVSGAELSSASSDSKATGPTAASGSVAAALAATPSSAAPVVAPPSSAGAPAAAFRATKGNAASASAPGASSGAPAGGAMKRPAGEAASGAPSDRAKKDAAAKRRL